LNLDIKSALELEAKNFSRLAVTPQSKSLISLFMLTEDCKKRKERTNNAPIIKVSFIYIHAFLFT
jgi:hypothetical protein